MWTKEIPPKTPQPERDSLLSPREVCDEYKTYRVKIMRTLGVSGGVNKNPAQGARGLSGMNDLPQVGKMLSQGSGF